MKWLLLFILIIPATWAQDTRPYPGIDATNAQFGPEAPSETQRHFFTKTWLLTTGIQSAATGFDIHETLSHEGRCALEGQNGFPEKVGTGELVGEAVVEVGFNVFVHALAYRAPKGFQWINHMTAVLATERHLQGGIEWYSRCN